MNCIDTEKDRQINIINGQTYKHIKIHRTQKDRYTEIHYGSDKEEEQVDVDKSFIEHKWIDVYLYVHRFDIHIFRKMYTRYKG